MLDELIPSSKKYNMPKASEVIDLAKLLFFIRKENTLVSESDELVKIRFKNEKKFDREELEIILKKIILKLYFSSSKVRGIIKKRNDLYLIKNNKIDIETYNLISKTNREKKIYRNI